ncbi:MAG: PleD family two-component system response regulator [Candidatus Methylomirabilales bacterium]
MEARILVADDSITIQKVVELTFSKENFELIPARSGEEAIRKAKEMRPDLMLIDTVMPDKSGYEVCRILRADPLLKDVPVIFLPGTFEAFDRAEAIMVGANDFVTKPFESQVLISKVKQLLFAKRAAAVEAAPKPHEPLKEEVTEAEFWQLLELAGEVPQGAAEPKVEEPTPLQELALEEITSEEPLAALEIPQETLAPEPMAQPEELFALEALEPSPTPPEVPLLEEVPPVQEVVLPEAALQEPATGVVEAAAEAAAERVAERLSREVVETAERAAAQLSQEAVEVTEKVAEKLRQEIVERLVERIERIVWEVVPDLAEVLIRKEIERIKAAVEGKR